MDERPMAPRSREASDAVREASRARVLDAARSLFARHGYVACRVSDIARRAGMSPGNVYWHYESKEAMLRAILVDGFDGLEAMTADVAAEYGPARRKLEILVARTIELYDRDAAFFVILGGLVGEGGRELVRSLGIDMDVIAVRYHANLRSVLAEARTEGAIAPADPDLLAVLYLALFNGLITTYGDRWPAMPRPELRDAALRLVGYRPTG
jgi:AcrR family transcriptional regulator